MYRKVWNNCQHSVCQISFYTSAGIKVLSMTGFKANEHFLITDDYLYKVKNASKVMLRFVESDGYTERASIKLPMKDFRRRIFGNYEGANLPFAVINIDFEEFSKIPSLQFNIGKKVSIGQPIAVIGYQLEKDNLSIKTGIVSSMLETDGFKHYQVDSSLKQGNSGSPLIDAETNEVIGIIGHKLATITQSHKRMKQIINNNLAILKKSQGKFNVEEIDPIQVLIANQNQIKHITNEIYKTATMSSGYALDISYVQDLFEEFVDAEVSNTSLKLRVGT